MYPGGIEQQQQPTVMKLTLAERDSPRVRSCTAKSASNFSDGVGTFLGILCSSFNFKAIPHKEAILHEETDATERTLMENMKGSSVVGSDVFSATTTVEKAVFQHPEL